MNSGNSGSDKRIHARRLLEEDIYCYLDGQRFDANSRDISAGGLFLRTERDVPLGSVLAVVFRTDEGEGGAPIFLLGMVVRRQLTPIPGIGLAWTRATTTGRRPMLARFLATKMEVVSGAITQERYGPRAQTRFVHHFSVKGLEKKHKKTPKLRYDTLIDADLPLPRTPRSAPARPEMSPQGLGASAKVLDSVDVQVIRGEGKVERRAARPLGEHVRKQSDKEASGPLSQLVQRGEILAAAEIPAKVHIGGKQFDGEVMGLGLRGMFVRLFVRVRGEFEKVEVVFDIQGRGGRIPIRCFCKLLYLDDSAAGPPGLELEISSYEEDGPKGVFWTYLKWLHFRSLKQG